MKRKLAALLLVVVLVFSLPIPAAAELNADVRNSVVVVKTLLDSNVGEFGFGTGTGFFINDQYLITNHHVIESFLKYGAGEDYELITETAIIQGRAKIRVHYDSKNYQDAFLVGYDEHKDIAILRLDRTTDERVPLKLKVPTEDMVGGSIYAVGYPGIADNAVDATQSWGKNDATVTSGTISRLLTESGTGRQAIHIDCTINSGNSGGPVVTANGEVVGIATWTSAQIQWNEAGITTSISEQNYAVNIQEAIYLLNQYGVSYTLASENAEGEEIQQIVIPEPEKENNLPLILISVFAVLIIAALVAVIVVMKKKGSGSAAAAPVVNEPRPVVRSYSQVNYGTSANVGVQPILIGRGNNCSLRFPGNAPGVSGSHCSVQWDPVSREFIVTDMNSTYGTFLMSGQKMTPNQPYRFRSGERFYLAEQKNTIALSLE